MMSPDTVQPGPGGANEPVDLTNCDQEPIHQLGSVQSFGCLIAFSDDWRVTRASENLASFCGQTPESVLGAPMAQLFSTETIHVVRTQAQLLSTPDAVNRVFGHELGAGNPLVDLSLHRSGEGFVLELERSSNAHETADFARVQSLVSRLKGKDNLFDLADEAARCLRALSGFDRVMVYRFNHDHSGDVIAEAKLPQQTPYLGLRFPASDIPKQARELYLRSPLRLIADVDAPVVPVLPGQGVHGEPLDLTLSVTRAVSPIHLEYLRNMGVAASMSVSIVRDGKLWGLFACHSEAPNYIDFRTRTAVELFAQLATYELAQFEMARMQSQMIEAQTLHQRLLTIAADGKLDQRFGDLAEQIGKVIAFDGIALRLGDLYLSEGSAPNADEFDALSNFLNRASGSDIFVTDALSHAYPDADDIKDRVAGILALPISRSPRDYIVLFRREIVQSVRWGGNPDKLVSRDAATGRLHPRKSFSLWKQMVKDHSSRWTDAELRTAEAVRITLLEIVLKITDAAERERARASEKQELIVAELNHRVRNILSLIRSLLQQSKSDTDDTAFRTLASRIQSFARAHDQLTGETPEDASFRRLIGIEMDAFIVDAPGRLEFTGPDAVLAGSAYTSLALVAHELVTNSAKYGAMSVPSGVLKIATELTSDGSLSIQWREVGGPTPQDTSRRGFGMTIIERTIPYQMGGEADVRFAADGLEVDFTIPAKHLLSSGAPKLAAVPDPTPCDAPLPETILIVEDNALIALDACETLLEFGATRVETVPSVAKAMREIKATNFDAVLLDVNLGTETSQSLAEEMAARGIPFCLVTGYAEQDGTLAGFPKAPLLRKPFSTETLVAAVAALRDGP